MRTDVSSAESAAAMVEATVAAYGGLDLLVNNAAIYGEMQFDLLISVDWDYYRKFMSVNMDGALVMTRAVYRADAEARRGRDRQPELDGGLPLLRLLRPGQGRRERPHPAARPRARRDGHPGQRDRARARPTPPATRTQAGDAAKDLVKSLAIKRMGQPDDMVGACLFLLSDESAWVTGQIIAVDGGQMFRA